jgi:hypothetical protein
VWVLVAHGDTQLPLRAMLDESTITDALKRVIEQLDADAMQEAQQTLKLLDFGSFAQTRTRR